jgi:hypothetical protein
MHRTTIPSAIAARVRTTLATGAAPLGLFCLFSLSCLVWLPGCGEGPVPTAEQGHVTAAASGHAVVPPLIADDGSLMPSLPGSEPTDPGARTRERRYATAAQAEQLEAALGERVVRIDSHDVARLGASTVAGIVHGLRAAADLGRDDPVLVQGRDARLSATLANQLADDGLTRVWIVAAP